MCNFLWLLVVSCSSLELAVNTGVSICQGKDDVKYASDLGSLWVIRTGREETCQSLISFDLGNITVETAALSAMFDLHTTKSSASKVTIAAHRMLQPWNSTSTWTNDFGGNGVQLDGVEAEFMPSFHYSLDELGVQVDASDDVRAWINGNVQNYGWVLFISDEEASNSWTTVVFSKGATKLRLFQVALPFIQKSFRQLQVDDNSVCFELNLEDSFGDGWNGAEYTISALDGTVVATGTIENGDTDTHEVCVVRSSCYSMKVTSGFYPDEISWSIGDSSEISGGAPADVEFYVLDDGQIVSGLCTSAPTMLSPAPTSISSPRTLIETASCSGNGCAMSISLDTASFAEYISSAYLTVDLESPEYTVIAINDVDEALYGNRDISECTETMRYIENRDITSEARHNGEIKVSFVVPQSLTDIILCDNWPDNAEVSKKAVVTLVATLSGTSYPTLVPTTALPLTSSSRSPTITGGAPSISLAPTIMPTFGISTYNGLKSALESSTSKSFVSGTILFPKIVTLEDAHVMITSSSNQAATFDGEFSTSLLDLTSTNLTLKKLTLRRGYGVYFGCIRAIMSQISILDSALVNCKTDISGGGAHLIYSSLLAVMSNFSSNSANFLGGVVYMSSNSTFTATTSSFDSNSAQEDGGVAYVRDSSIFTATNSSFDSNSAQDFKYIYGNEFQL
uniref:Right handed beta helix domain-containing protein n=1 Tax=Aureoumbra lagunensis TaxID=44058 RepID=A0A7S3JZC0_9STRA